MVTVRRLREAGWTVHRIADIYPDDAQGVSDEVWIEYGCRHGWTLLTKDRRIRYRAEELSALAADSLLFCLAKQDLTTEQMVGAFRSAAGRIERAVARREAGFWHVYADGNIKRMWP